MNKLDFTSNIIYQIAAGVYSMGSGGWMQALGCIRCIFITSMDNKSINSINSTKQSPGKQADVYGEVCAVPECF